MPTDSGGREVVVETLSEPDHAAVRRMLVDLALVEQDSYDHPRQTRAQVEAGMPPVRAHFSGENHLIVVRDEPDGDPVGVCWCVLFDPGTGLEG